jgi:hypothetical protein
MKKVLGILALLSMTAIFGCGNIEVRVQNDFRSDLANFKIGTLDFDTVKTGATTSYQEIEEGAHVIYVNGKETGNVSFENTIFTPNSRWTLTVSDDDSGKYVLTED